MSDRPTLEKLSIHAPNPSFGSVEAEILSAFKDGSVHTVMEADPAHVVEPVTFLPYHKKGDPGYESDENKWLLHVKNGLWPEFGNAGDLIAPFLVKGTVVIPIPSSTVNRANGITRVVQYMAEHKGVVNGSAFLIRHEEVPKQHLNPGGRQRQTHLDSIVAELPESYREHRILLLDDIFTSGTTMSACLELLRETGAIHVTCATLGRTE